MEQTELCDTVGSVKVSEVYIFRINTSCYVSHVLTSRIVEYSLSDKSTLDQNSSKTMNRGDSDNRVPLCHGYSSPNACFVFAFFFRGWKIYVSSGERTCTRYNIPPSSIKQAWEKMSERLPGAALVWFTLICTDEPFWPWPGNHQPAPALSIQPLMKEVQISSRSTLMLPLHIRQLFVWQQEAITQIYVQKTKGNLNVF